MNLLDVLRSGRVLLMDGAMGTELQRAGLKPGENSALWNFLHPECVRAVHQAYLDAGAEVCLTNTFLVNDESFLPDLRTCAAERRTAAEWRGVTGYRGPWKVAYELIGRRAAYRLGAVGPVAGSKFGREFNAVKRFLVVNTCNYTHPHDCLHFPHAILLETCSTPRVRYALRRLIRHKRCPLLLSMTFLRNEAGRLVTLSGHAPEWFAERAKRYGADALGVNCGRDIGMEEIIEIIRRYRRETDLPLFARPNAGKPKQVRKRWVYPHTPKYMASRLPELLEAGVCMVGGCCGTTPAHIAAFKPVVDAWNKAKRK